MDPLQWLVKGTLIIFVVSSMLSIGLAVQRAQIVAPLRSPAWILRALLANFVLAPVVALSIGAMLTIDPGYELGLLLLGFAAGAPLLPKLAEAGRADVASATALMVLLMAASVVVMPLALPLFVKGVQVSPWQIAAPLVVLMLAPLALGMAARSLAPRIGARLLPALTKTSNIGFVAVVLLVCGTNLTALAAVLGSGAIGAALLFVVLLFAGAWALGEPNPPGRRLLGYATAGRNIGAALVTAGASAAEPKATVMLIVTGVVGLAGLLAITAWVRRRDGPAV
jgi:bile acid:Na+ symporter, BASS family